MFSVLNTLNKQDFSEIVGVSSKEVGKKPIKLLDKIGKAKTKKEKRKIINDWILEEIVKINKNSETDDF